MIEYQPEKVTITKDALYAGIAAVKSGIEYARMTLLDHDSNLGRSTLKNKVWAERIESDIRQMEAALKLLTCNRKEPNEEIDKPQLQEN